MKKVIEKIQSVEKQPKVEKVIVREPVVERVVVKKVAQVDEKPSVVKKLEETVDKDME